MRIASWNCNLNLKSKFERVSELKPDILFLQGPSFHQDHTAVYEASIAALRASKLVWSEMPLIMFTKSLIPAVTVCNCFTDSEAVLVSLDITEVDCKVADSITIMLSSNCCDD